MELSKASLFTLIVMAKTSASAIQQIDAINQKYPCKVILITLDHSSPHSCLARKGTYTHTIENTSIQYDVCLIEASTDQIHKIPFLVIPEISSDSPSFLFVEGSPLKNPLVTSLEPYVERIFFDTIPHDTKSFALDLLSLPLRSKYVDLNWIKIKSWRQAFYRVFSSNEKVSHLQSSTTLNISFCGTSSESSFQSILLQAWIAKCLSWNLVSTGPQHITYTSNGQKHLITLNPTVNTIVESGSIDRVEFFGDSDIHYLLSYETDDRHINVQASTEAFCEVPYSLFVDSYQKGKALANEILQQKTSESYFPALEILTSISWQKD